MSTSLGGVSWNIYTSDESPIHRLEARAKVLCALGLLAAVLVVPVVSGWPKHLVLAALVGAVLALGKLPITGLLRQLRWIAIFFLGLCLFLPFFRPHSPQDVLALPQGLTCSRQGVELILSFTVKGTMVVATIFVLIATTGLHKLTVALSTLGVPHRLVELLSFIQRYVIVLGDEAQRMDRARRLRGGGRTFALRVKAGAGLAASLLVRTCLRAERVAAAMVTRGYTGRLPRLTQPPMSGGAIVLTVSFWIALGMLVIW